MNPLAAAIRREFRVAFSRHTQPVWFRIVKWSCILTGIILFYAKGWFWWTLLALALIGTVVHLIYRAQTKGWTRCWGGWNDLPEGRY